MKAIGNGMWLRYFAFEEGSGGWKYARALEYSADVGGSNIT
jgi:hypothetical protein